MSGYKKWAGQRLAAEELVQMIDAIEENGLFNYTHVLTGPPSTMPYLFGVLIRVQGTWARRHC